MTTMKLRLSSPTGKFDILPYGFILPGKCLPFNDKACGEQFLSKFTHYPYAWEQLTNLHAELYRIERVRPARSTTIIRQLAKQLNRGQLFVCPVEEEKAGVATTRAAAGGSIVPLKPQPRPCTVTDYQRKLWEEPVVKKIQKYKIVIEVAGQCSDDLNGFFEITRLADEDHRRDGSFKCSTCRDPHRLLVIIDNVPDKPRELRYAIGTERLPLANTVSPVTEETEKGEWENVLIPVLPLYCTSLENKANATMLPSGWLYVFVNGYLWRELQVHNNVGVMGDVELGHDAGKDQRSNTTQMLSVLLLPYKINGQLQTIHMAHSRTQWSWEDVGKAGGTDPNDIRLLPRIKQKTANIAIDEAITSKLQPIDLSSYQQGFSGGDPHVEHIDQAPGIVAYQGEEPDMISRYRGNNIPVVYLQGVKAFFSIKLVAHDGQALQNVKYRLILGESDNDPNLQVIESQSADGVIEHDVSGEVNTGVLQFWPDSASNRCVIRPIKLSVLNCQTDQLGLKQRLSNLCYQVEPADTKNTVNVHEIALHHYKKDARQEDAASDVDIIGHIDAH